MFVAAFVPPAAFASLDPGIAVDFGFQVDDLIVGRGIRFRGTKELGVFHSRIFGPGEIVDNKIFL